jgi:hypothetical protein
MTAVIRTATTQGLSAGTVRDHAAPYGRTTPPNGQPGVPGRPRPAPGAGSPSDHALDRAQGLNRLTPSAARRHRHVVSARPAAPAAPARPPPPRRRYARPAAAWAIRRSSAGRVCSRRPRSSGQRLRVPGRGARRRREPAAVRRRRPWRQAGPETVGRQHVHGSWAQGGTARRPSGAGPECRSGGPDGPGKHRRRRPRPPAVPTGTDAPPRRGQRGRVKGPPRVAEGRGATSGSCKRHRSGRAGWPTAITVEARSDGERGGGPDPEFDPDGRAASQWPGRAPDHRRRWSTSCRRITTPSANRPTPRPAPEHPPALAPRTG